MDASLISYSRNDTSEHGEDGIIEHIFQIIGAQSRWCIELGALNGTHGSNVWTLIKNAGWSGVLIEADPTYFEKLKAEYADIPGAHCINAFVSFEGPHSLDAIFSRTPIPKEFDLFSLDIDGNEYHLWESMHEYRPRVMVVEFNPTMPNSLSFIQPRDMTVFQGSSLRAFVSLAQQKGYELVASNGANAFFVLREFFPLFGIKDNSIDAIHTNHELETALFQLYDGTIKIAGNTRMVWHNVPIAEDCLQVLSRRKRRYPARISESDMLRTIKYHVRKLPLYALLQKIRRAIFS